jgi:hypothetical protein
VLKCSAYIYILESINRTEFKTNTTELLWQVGNKLLVSEMEKLCKHATEKLLVKCVVSVRTDFFSARKNFCIKRKMSPSSETSDLESMWL